MPNCKNCGHTLTIMDRRKSWTMIGAKGTETKIDLYDCPRCKKTTRIGTRL